MRTKRKIQDRRRTKFAFVVDGESEFWYLQMLKRNERCLDLNLEPKIPQKKSLKDQKELVLELSNHYDKVFWIIDYDVINTETQATKKGEMSSINEFKKYYKDLTDGSHPNVRIIINNPCFEFWFLLHFKFTTKYYNSCDNVILDLKKHTVLKAYSKSRKFFTKEGSDIYLRLKPYLKTAMNNSSKFQKFDFDNPNKGLSQMNIFFEIDNIKKMYNVTEKC